MATCAKCGGTFDEATGPCPICLNSVATQPATPPSPAPATKGSGTKVMILVALAVLGVLVVFCVGIIAAIALPNLLSAKNRAQQKRAVSDVKSMATAVLAFQTDWNAFPDSGGQAVPVSELPGLCDALTQASAGKPSNFLADYAPAIATADAHGTPYYYAGNAEHFLIVALGSDKRCDGDLDQTVGAWMAPWPESGAPVQPKETHCYENDIVWADYSFLWAPENNQSHCGDQGGHDGPPQFGEPN